jgi:hypothetical protein
MTDPNDTTLESRLTGLTVWRKPVPNLWRRALDDASRPRRMWTRRLPRWLGAGALAAAALVIAAITARFTAFSGSDNPAPTAAGRMVYRDTAKVTDALGRNAGSGRRGLEFAGEQVLQTLTGVRAASEPDVSPNKLAEPTAQSRIPSAAPPAPGILTQEPARHVIRKATLELATPDVRAAFLKGQQITSEARGEFIQDSSLTGAGKEAQASLTLRVAADRLAQALNQLRDLAGQGGEVRSENITGEDVTSQAVDLDARLRNEQRVETELLTLLEKRTDAPLKEILELRDHISAVRSQIEQLTAQRDRLSRLVSLATILVLIRPTDAPPPAAVHDHIGKYFSDNIATAWTRGLHLLADTLAEAVGLLIGGLIWWLLLLLAILFARRWLRRKLPAWAIPPAAPDAGPTS